MLAPINRKLIGIELGNSLYQKEHLRELIFHQQRQRQNDTHQFSASFVDISPLTECIHYSKQMGNNYYVLYITLAWIKF